MIVENVPPVGHGTRWVQTVSWTEKVKLLEWCSGTGHTMRQRATWEFRCDWRCDVCFAPLVPETQPWIRESNRVPGAVVIAPGRSFAVFCETCLGIPDADLVVKPTERLIHGLDWLMFCKWLCNYAWFHPQEHSTHYDRPWWATGGEDFSDGIPALPEIVETVEVLPTPRKRQAIAPTLRARILERDNFRCRRCGNGPQNARLVIDHITPVVLGGTNVDTNLQTLCEPCNQGKADRLPHPHDLCVPPS